MANTGNSQQQINYGAAANDGQGDPLRTAFIKTDDNFDAIWATGPVGSNITIVNNTVQVMNTNGNLVLAANGVGVIQTNTSLSPRFTNLYDIGSANLRYRSVHIGTGGLSVTANISATGHITGNNVNATTSLGLPVYANTTVRDSTISSPQPGMMIFVTGTGLQVRGATAWNTVTGTAT